VIELHYQGEVIGWAYVSPAGCVLEPANLEIDGPLLEREGATITRFVQDLSFAA
jgi:hypothetical protein